MPEVKLFAGKLYVNASTKNEEVIRKALENWYKDKANEKINERVKYYQQYFDIKPSKVVIKEQKKRWGTCTSNRKLLFNWKSIMAPSPIIDYIVVHEMCHLIHMNHAFSEAY